MIVPSIDDHVELRRHVARNAARRLAACGVTDGTILRGVRFFGAGKRTQSLVMTTETMHVRFVDTVHVEGGPDSFVRFDR